VTKRKVYKGHHFKHTVAKGNARVQYGDVYNLGSCCHQSLALAPPDSHSIRIEKYKEVQLKFAIVTLLVLSVLERILEHLLTVIPGAIGGRISVFEDALGRTWRIDIDTISGWQVSTSGTCLPLKQNPNQLQRNSMASCYTNLRTTEDCNVY
jgi:hypothetical protein